MALPVLLLFMVIMVIVISSLPLVDSYKKRDFSTAAIFAFFIIALLILGPIGIKLSYDDYLKERAASVAENDLNSRYNLDNLEVWYGVKDFSFTDGKKDCVGKLTKQNGHYDITRKPNGEPDVECTIEKKVSWQPTNRAN